MDEFLCERGNPSECDHHAKGRDLCKPIHTLRTCQNTNAPGSHDHDFIRERTTRKKTHTFTLSQYWCSVTWMYSYDFEDVKCVDVYVPQRMNLKLLSDIHWSPPFMYVRMQMLAKVAEIFLLLNGSDPDNLPLRSLHVKGKLQNISRPNFSYLSVCVWKPQQTLIHWHFQWKCIPLSFRISQHI